MLSNLHVYPTIPAHDINRAREFYEGVLGFTPMREASGGVIYETAGRIAFLLYPTSNAGTAQHTLASWLTDDIDGLVGDLRRRGVVFEEYDFPGLRTVNGIADLDGERAAWFKDTEGNILAVGEIR